MAGKTKSLVDAFTGSGLFKQARESTDSIRTVSGQDGGAMVAPLSRDNNVIVAPKGHHNRTGQEQDRNRTGTGHHQDKKFREVTLAGNQLKIYDWFLKRGLHGAFNKPLIEDETGVAYGTIRKVMVKLENLGMIRVQYDRCSKEYEYTINPDVNVKRPNLGQYQDSIRTVSGQYQDTISYNIEEEDSYYLLLLPKIRTVWTGLHGIGFDADQFRDIIGSWKLAGRDLGRLHESLERADYAVEHGNVKEKDSPLDYVYAALMRGEYRKPAGYKSQVELDLERQLAEERDIAEKRRELLELKFKNDVLADPDGDAYRQCFESLNKYAKRLEMDDPNFQAAMFQAFQKLMENIC